MEPWLVEAAKQFPLAAAMTTGFIYFLRYHTQELTALKKEHDTRIIEMAKEYSDRLKEVTLRESEAARAMVAVVAENNRALGSVSTFMMIVQEKRNDPSSN